MGAVDISVWRRLIRIDSLRRETARIAWICGKTIKWSSE
jgi:hypothetical protein